MKTWLKGFAVITIVLGLASCENKQGVEGIYYDAEVSLRTRVIEGDSMFYYFKDELQKVVKVEFTEAQMISYEGNDIKTIPYTFDGKILTLIYAPLNKSTFLKVNSKDEIPVQVFSSKELFDRADRAVTTALKWEGEGLTIEVIDEVDGVIWNIPGVAKVLMDEHEYLVKVNGRSMEMTYRQDPYYESMSFMGWNGQDVVQITIKENPYYDGMVAEYSVGPFNPEYYKLAEIK